MMPFFEVFLFIVIHFQECSVICVEVKAAYVSAYSLVLFVLPDMSQAIYYLEEYGTFPFSVHVSV